MNSRSSASPQSGFAFAMKNVSELHVPVSFYFNHVSLFFLRCPNSEKGDKKVSRTCSIAIHLSLLEAF